jgi:DNA mismatch repair ATPase MutS
VVSIITPGTYIQEHQKQSSFMLAIHFSPYKDGNAYHIAWGDFTLGEYWTKSFVDIPEMQKFILTIKPVEIIFDIDFPQKDLVSTPLVQYMKCLISLYETPSDQESFLKNTCKVQSL